MVFRHVQGCPDHPRIRGEHPIGLVPGDGVVGSSPHTRGARARPLGPPAPGRIIPAYAGSTTPEDPEPIKPPGSSPHTRGAQQRHHRRRRSRRIIPAYAGSTALVHRCPWMACWIIPAYAGSTPSGTGPAGISRDHPRIRGEHRYGPYRGTYSTGSSPHTRGALQLIYFGVVGAGIIPAYAGSTRETPAICRIRTDHPRIRGEHEAEFTGIGGPAGSSPHTRGAHRCQRRP